MARIRKKYCMVLFLVLLISLIFYLKRDDKRQLFSKFFPDINFTTVVDPHTIQNRGRYLKKEDRKIKTILLFTTHFYSDVWKGLHPDVLDDYAHDAKCTIPECTITYDKRKISTADVVVFHGVDFGYKNFTSQHFHALSNLRPHYQRWVFWMHETPVYYPEAENYNNLFNWTMTFSEQSDIYHPYYSYTHLSEYDERPGKYINFASGKDKKIVWMVSHCGMTRAEYAMELQKYTDITVYGLCGTSFDNMGGVCSKVESECWKQLSRYKFYLSFENSFCEDYITEKYYKFGLIYGLVPIVMGARYNNLNSVPGSYIDVSKFSSIEELGDYINYLDTHDDVYNKYFEWRYHFKVTDGVDKICMLCQAVHNLDRKENTHKDFHTFWSTYNLCDPYEKVRQEMEHQIAISKERRKKKMGIN